MSARVAVFTEKIALSRTPLVSGNIDFRAAILTTFLHHLLRHTTMLPESMDSVISGACAALNIYVDRYTIKMLTCHQHWELALEGSLLLKTMKVG